MMEQLDNTRLITRTPTLFTDSTAVLKSESQDEKSFPVRESKVRESRPVREGRKSRESFARRAVEQSTHEHEV